MPPNVDSQAPDFILQVAHELNLPEASVRACAALLADGSTVPFIARYRKEVTGQLDEVQIRQVAERHQYLAELAARRLVILTAIRDAQKLTPELEKKLQLADTKAALEDLYLPFKPKRRTRGMIAKERGLLPLAEKMAAQGQEDPEAFAQTFVDPSREVPDVAHALSGARDVVAEQLAENADIRAYVRDKMSREALITSEVTPEHREASSKFEQYYAFEEPIQQIPSHRYLALRRGERDGVLRLKLRLDSEPIVAWMLGKAGHDVKSPWGRELTRAAESAYTRLLAPSVETDIRVALKIRSDVEAVDVFASNLKNLLLAAPVGRQSVLAIDPGARTGCKCVMLTERGQFLAHETFYLVGSESQRHRAKDVLLRLVSTHQPQLIAIGNGTFGRETEAFCRATLNDLSEGAARHIVMVSEAGASVYSASDVAREEFPELDVTIRGAISIGRRLQDPLAELVKIDPKAIGVGQYQHDVHQPLLGRKLDEVVESCVNFVGVELATASAALLGYVAGVGRTLAQKIIAEREAKGGFTSRQDLLRVSGMGQKTFEQAAGFLRIHGGEEPLDASGVHPERYALVGRMAETLGVSTRGLVGDVKLAGSLNLKSYVGDGIGMPTLLDIQEELKKPGRDPRDSFVIHRFKDGVTELEHLRVGMDFAGKVTNVTAFGAFVDIGVHQDGLVHISALSEKFVSDPHQVTKVGETLRVWVHEVDLVRRRIALSARGAPTARSPNSDSSAETASHPKRAFSGPKRPRSRPEPHRPPDAGHDSLRHNPFAKLRLS